MWDMSLSGTIGRSGSSCEVGNQGLQEATPEL